MGSMRGGVCSTQLTCSGHWSRYFQLPRVQMATDFTVAALEGALTDGLR